MMKSLNLYAFIALVGLGGVIVSGIFMAGKKAEKNSVAAEIARVNVPLAEQRGKDEAELASNDAMAKVTDAAVRAELKQTCILTEETVTLLAKLK